jgi:hypothetical protein
MYGNGGLFRIWKSLVVLSGALWNGNQTAAGPPQAVLLAVYTLRATFIFGNAKNGLKTALKALNVKHTAKGLGTLLRASMSGILGCFSGRPQV